MLFTTEFRVLVYHHTLCVSALNNSSLRVLRGDTIPQ